MVIEWIVLILKKSGEVNRIILVYPRVTVTIR